MEHYISKSALVAEIEKKKIGYNTDGKHSVEYNTVKKILDIIDTLEVKKMQEEFVSEDLEEAARRYAALQAGMKDAMTSEYYEEYPYSRNDIKAYKDGAKWQKEQMEAYRIEHCKSLTNEQAELEDNFVSSHVEKNNRIPTFIDAIEYGIEYGKQQMMAKAVDASCFDRFQGSALFSFRLPTDKYLVGSDVKVIVIKED